MIGSGKSEDNLGRNFRTVIASGGGCWKRVRDILRWVWETFLFCDKSYSVS